jgi:8-oxo-dGTP pyrophosphatase MutT (NUDIX family)
VGQDRQCSSEEPLYAAAHPREAGTAMILAASEGREPLGPWQVLRSKTLVASPWLTVYRQRIRTAHGHVIPEYYVMDCPDFVTVLALTSAGEAILVEQYRHGPRCPVIELPSGLIDPVDASPRAAAERELLEETGYRAGTIESLGKLFPSTARQSNQTHFFLALDCVWAAQPRGDPAEYINVRLLPLGELRALAARCELPSQTSMSCLFLALERLGAHRPDST